MKSIKHILTSIAVLAGFVCQAQNPVDSLVVPVATADSLTVPQEYSDIYLDTVKVDRVFEINDYSTVSRSRSLVGSSRSRLSGLPKRAFASMTRTFSLLLNSAIIF